MGYASEASFWGYLRSVGRRVMVRKYLQHKLNPLHLFCFFRNCGFSKEGALTLAGLLSNCFHVICYKRRT